MPGTGGFELGKSLRSCFKLNENIIYLNHGSYGCVPKPVLEAQRKLALDTHRRKLRLLHTLSFSGSEFRATEHTVSWVSEELGTNTFQILVFKLIKKYPYNLTNKSVETDEIESNPAQWYFYQSEQHWYKAVQRIATFVKSDPKNLVFVTNVTNGVNAVLRSLKFNEGQTILITDHTYGAVRKTAQEICNENNAELSVLNLSFPISDVAENPEFCIADVVDQYHSVLQKNPNIKLAIIDYITSSSAIMLPVKKLIQVCRQHGVLVLIDGAHSPGQVQLDLENLDADFYVGNLHKWLFCPRGSAVLWVHPKHQHYMNPVLVSWHHNKTFNDMFFEQGTIDYSPYLCVEDALKFYEDLGGAEGVIEHNRSLVNWAAHMLASEWDTEVLPLPEKMRSPFMICVRLPHEFQNTFGLNYRAEHSIREHLYKKFKIVTAIFTIQSRLWCRVVASVYNCKEDYFLLAKAVNKLKQDIVSGELTR